MTKKGYSLNGPLNSTSIQRILLLTHTLDISFAYSDCILVVQHFNSENEELQFLFIFWDASRKVFYLKIRDSNTLIFQLQFRQLNYLKVVPISCNRRCHKDTIFVPSLSKGKIFFTPGLATRLAVVTKGSPSKP